MLRRWNENRSKSPSLSPCFQNPISPCENPNSCTELQHLQFSRDLWGTAKAINKKQAQALHFCWVAGGEFMFSRPIRPWKKMSVPTEFHISQWPTALAGGGEIRGVSWASRSLARPPLEQLHWQRLAVQCKILASFQARKKQKWSLAGRAKAKSNVLGLPHPDQANHEKLKI